MRVTSLMGGTPGRDGPGGGNLRSPWRRWRERAGPGTFNPVSRQVLAATRDPPLSIPAAWPQVLNCFGTPLALSPAPGPPAAAPGCFPERAVGVEVAWQELARFGV